VVDLLEKFGEPSDPTVVGNGPIDVATQLATTTPPTSSGPRDLVSEFNGPAAPKLGGFTAFDQFLSQAANEVGDAILGIPDLIITAAANIPAPFDPPQVETDENGQQQIRQRGLLELATGIRTPALGENVTGIPTTEEVRAGVDAGVTALGQVPNALATNGEVDVQGLFDQARADQEARKQEFPIATTAGELAGSGLALATGRVPVARQAARTAAATRLAGSPPRIDPSRLGEFQSVGKRLRSTFDKTVKSKPVQALQRGALRTAETGFEAAVLTALQREDPAVVAAMAAGTQAASSLILTATKFPITSPVKAAATVGGLVVMTRLAQEFTPGDNNIFNAVDFTFDKAAYGLVLGGMAGIAGSRLARGSATGRNNPEIVEGLLGLQRGAVIQFVKDTRDFFGIGEVADAVSTSPDQFKSEHIQRLANAFNSEKTDNLSTVNDLLKIKSFRDAFDAVRSGGLGEFAGGS